MNEDRLGPQAPRGGLAVDRRTVLVGGMLAAVTVAAWAGVVTQAVPPNDMAMRGGLQPAGAIGFIGAWVVMMAAMMLPSAAPLLLLYRVAGQGGRSVNTIPLVAGYLVVWAAFGALVYTAQQTLLAVTDANPALGVARPYGVAGILAIAGAYQFSRRPACAHVGLPLISSCSAGMAGAHWMPFDWGRNTALTVLAAAGV